MKILGIIPARYKSSRFPGKPLALILGKPLIIYVCEIAEEALGKENVVVATDSNQIADLVKSFGYNYCLTSPDHLTGTDRLVEVSEKMDSDIYLNIQGDEPLINPLDIKKIAENKTLFPDFIINGMTYISDSEDPNSINIPKVVVDCNSKLLYMSRAAIPGSKNPSNNLRYLKQVCIYAFNKEELQLMKSNPTKTPLEDSEDIEILRFLELGRNVKMVHLSSGSLAVDVPSDIKNVENELRLKKV
ncbi:MAG: 3-deoxy-manno-octulosonate cytidylyltransferase [Bacteroidia bacterium]|nr:3-deoxy-manno-octulosonate cytidylyltransferase [Bacteroidia bacterium]NNJ55856.1 3-deoxy-manno-octulosonate cytidylyltransferase [Bacteroidia bacterium]